MFSAIGGWIARNGLLALGGAAGLFVTYKAVTRPVQQSQEMPAAFFMPGTPTSFGGGAGIGEGGDITVSGVGDLDFGSSDDLMLALATLQADTDITLAGIGARSSADMYSAQMQMLQMQLQQDAFSSQAQRDVQLAAINAQTQMLQMQLGSQAGNFGFNDPYQSGSVYTLDNGLMFAPTQSYNPLAPVNNAEYYLPTNQSVLQAKTDRIQFGEASGSTIEQNIKQTGMSAINAGDWENVYIDAKRLGVTSSDLAALTGQPLQNVINWQMQRGLQVL